MNRQPLIDQYFRWVVHHPRSIVLASALLITLVGSFVLQITKDTRADAFLSDDNPALVYRDKVKELFGLSDPMVVAVVAPDSIFTPEALNTIHKLTQVIRDLNNIDPDRVTSLATENNIRGTDEGLEVNAFFSENIFDDNPIADQKQANQIRDAIRNFPLYQGSLVANDESASLIVAELLDEDQSTDTYHLLLNTLDNMELPDGITLHVAGEGAIAGYLGSYIDADAQRLNPLAGLVITIMLFIAFMRVVPTLMANVIIMASAALTLGTMAAVDVPFYVITNALPVILIGISVADSIHIYSEYFERRALHPQETIQESIVESMKVMWRPTTLTTLTTAAGFLGLAIAAYMPPFRAFGIFTAIGVSVAWLYSITFLPAVMSLLKTEPPKRFIKQQQSQQHDGFARLMMSFGKLTTRHSLATVFITAVIFLVGLLSASKIVINEVSIDTFHPSEPIHRADKIINEKFDGTYYLNIVIETQEPEGMFEPHVLNKMEQLQLYVDTLPNVQSSTSIVDYLKQMNKSLNEGQQNFYVLPQNKDLIAQYFLLYSASSDPTDFEEEVDYNYQLANIRVEMNTGAYQDIKPVVESLDAYVKTQFNDEQVSAHLSGRVNLTYHWIKDLGQSHFTGMLIALMLVWTVASLLFRSATAGLFALLPVASSVLLIYSAMVILNIPLGIGTSMFAAVAIGLGVDFAIHTIDRLRGYYQNTLSMEKTLALFYPSTGRALLFNVLAIALGFGVLMTSQVIPLRNFGAIVALSVTVSFLMSMSLLPALVKLLKPKFVIDRKENTMIPGPSTSIVGICMGLLLSGLLIAPNIVEANDKGHDKISFPSKNASLPKGSWVMKNVKEVDEGQHVIRKLTMTMIDKRQKKRVRETMTYRKYFGEEKRTVLFYLSPRNVKDTGFLTYDYPQADKDDDQWLYLPAMRKARRISASDRGDYFLGTDLTYEDIKNEGKPELTDYHYTTIGKENLNGIETLLIEGIPVDKTTAEELGYGKVHSWVNPENWIVLKSEIWDVKLNPLKTVVNEDIKLIDNIWTRHKITVNNHKTQHQTELVFSEVDYKTDISDKLFTRQALTRGVPK